MNDYITIELSQQGKNKGQYKAIVSNEDSDLANFRWSVLIQGHRQYAYRKVPKTTEYRSHHYKLHQIILERKLDRPLVKGEYVDHIDNDGLNNRRENLRLVTSQQNAFNTRKHKDNSTGYKGVTYFKRDNNYRAQLSINGKNTHIGYFDTPELAYQAVCEARENHHGEYANNGSTD